MIASHRYTAQVCLVVLVSMSLTYVTAVLNYRTYWNLAWMMFVPLLIGFLFSRDLGRRLLMGAVILPAMSLLAVMVVGGALGGI